MLLVIDVGNTNIVLGVYKDTELLDHWRISTDRQRTTDEYGVLIRELFYLNDLRADDINAIIISSVVPPVVPTLERMCQRYFGLSPLLIGPGVKTGMDIRYDNPREVGADRIVNAVAAYEVWRPRYYCRFRYGHDFLCRRCQRGVFGRLHLSGYRHIHGGACAKNG